MEVAAQDRHLFKYAKNGAMRRYGCVPKGKSPRSDDHASRDAKGFKKSFSTCIAA
jgi:hypothetical protein